MRGSDLTLRRGLALALAALALVAAGCGGKSKSSSSSTSSSSTATSASKPGHVAPAPGEKKLGSKPEIGKPTGSPPATLQARDIVKGTGKKAKSGDKVAVQYVGIAWSTAKQFDASWDRHQPFTFQLGGGMVIASVFISLMHPRRKAML